MATIEELLGASAKDIAAMDDTALSIYLKDITNLEPPKLGTQIVGNEEDEEEDNIPIRKKSSKKKKTIAEMEKEMADLEKELGL